MSLPVIAIIGRPNVGKSTLFNRLSGSRIAIVSDVPGTTRDRVSTDADWYDRSFLLIDTGGIEDRPAADSVLWREVREQTLRALDSADVGILMVDLAEGLTASDYEAAELARRSGKPVIVAANKADNRSRLADLHLFEHLGSESAIPISAYHNTGIDELMTRVFESMPPANDTDIESGAIKIAITGRPNVGKSALFNALIGEERAIVSPIAGTTRDALDTLCSYGDTKLLFVDTAGLRRRGKTDRGIEKYSAIRAIGAIERSDVAVIVMDATEFVTAQDTHIAGFADSADRSGVIVINKWDLAAETGITDTDAMAEVRDRFKFIPGASIVFASALTGEGVGQIFEFVLKTYAEFSRHLDQSELSREWYRALGERPLPSRTGRHCRIRGIEQVGVRPPTFVIMCRRPELIHFSYKRYLENRLRARFGFAGTPLRMIYRSEGRRRHE